MKKVLLVLALICLVAIAVWISFTRTSAGPMQDISPLAPSATTSQVAAPADSAPLATSTPQTEAVGADTRRYKNATFHFSLVYPNRLQALENKEKGGALTVTFEDPDTNEGFEVYITPYAEDSVTRERFMTDEPSGVYQEPVDVVIGGVRATMFFGSNPLMGDTREVWFIKGGYLYEVVTYKELDTWLGGIMSSWKFI